MNEKGQLSLDAIMTVPIKLIMLFVVLIMLVPIYAMLDSVVGNFAYSSIIQVVYRLIPLILVVLIFGSIYLSYKYREQQQQGNFVG